MRALRVMMAAALMALPSAANAADLCQFLTRATTLAKQDPSLRALSAAGLTLDGYRCGLEQGSWSCVTLRPPGQGVVEKRRVQAAVEKCLPGLPLREAVGARFYTLSTAPGLILFLDSVALPVPPYRTTDQWQFSISAK